MSKRALVRLGAALGIAALLTGGIFAVVWFTDVARNVTPEREVAWQVFQQLEAKENDAAKTGEAFDLQDVDFKVPAGVVALANGDNYELSDRYQYEGRYTIAVLTVSDGSVFATQWPHGGRAFFPSVEAYQDWDWQEHSVSLPKITSVGAAVNKQIRQCEIAYYDEFGSYASVDDLVEFSARDDNPLPDLTLPDSVAFTISADEYGYFSAVRVRDTDELNLSYSYGMANSFGYETALYLERRADGSNPLGEMVAPNEQVPRPQDQGSVPWLVPPPPLPPLPEFD